MRRRARFRALAMSASMLLGCGGSTAPSTGWPAGQPPPAPAPTLATPGATAANPAPSLPAPSPSSSPAAVPAALTGLLQPLATGNIHGPRFMGWQRGYPVVQMGGWGVHALIGVDDNQQYVVDERNWRGVNTTVLVDAVGDYAGDAFLMGFSDTGRAVGEGAIFARRGGGTWRMHKKLPYLRYYAGMHRWSKGRVLAFERNGGMVVMSNKPPRFVVVDGARGGADLPQPTLEDAKDFRGKTFKTVKVGDRHMIAFESGHVYLLGHGIEHFKPGERKGTILEEGLGKGYGWSFAKRGEREVYALRDVTVVKVNGDQVERFPLPLEPTKRSSRAKIAVTDGGTIWAVTRGLLFRKAPGGDFERVAVPNPEGLEAVDVADVAARGDQVWVTASGKKGKEGRALIAWTGPKPSTVARLEAQSDWGGTAQYATDDLERPKPAGPGCNSVFALFYGITKYAAPGYDFPKAREALKGQTRFAKARFVKTDVGGQQYFGAFVETLADGRDLVTLIAKEVEGSTPQLLCHRPKVVAELGIDLATGSSRGWTAVKE